MDLLIIPFLIGVTLMVIVIIVLWYANQAIQKEYYKLLQLYKRASRSEVFLGGLEAVLSEDEWRKGMENGVFGLTITNTDNGSVIATVMVKREGQ